MPKHKTPVSTLDMPISELRRLEDLPSMAPALAARQALSDKIDAVNAQIDAFKRNISINRQALRADDSGPAKVAVEAEIAKLHVAEGQYAELRKQATLDVEESREAARAEVLPALRELAADDLDALIRVLSHVQTIERLVHIPGHWGHVAPGVKHFLQYMRAARATLESEVL